MGKHNSLTGVLMELIVQLRNIAKTAVRKYISRNMGKPWMWFRLKANMPERKDSSASCH